MYSSNSQDYTYIPDAYMHQPARRNEVPHSSQMNHGHTQFVGSIYPNGTGHLQMSYSNEIYGMAPPLIQDTAESIQRDFDQFMRDTAGSRAPFPSATHNSANVAPQHLPTTVNPKDLYIDNSLAHTQNSRSGQKTMLSSRGKEPSTSSIMRHHHSSASKPYAKVVPVAQPTGRRENAVNKDTRTFPVQLAAVMGPGPLEPAGYVVVPQGIFCCGPTMYQPIEFMPLGWERLGNKAIKRFVGRHRVEQPRDDVLSGFLEIMIKIQWPGYSHFPFEIRIGIKEGRVTRGELVELVCDAVVEFVEQLKDNHTKVNRDREEWMIGNRSCRLNKFFVPRLIHRGGNYFQPEIWVPE